MAGVACTMRLRDNEMARPAREIDYEKFYLPNICLGCEPMPWPELDAEAEIEVKQSKRAKNYEQAEEAWLAREDKEVEDRLEKASPEWLQAIAMEHLSGGSQ